MNVENVKFWKQQESFVLCAGKKVSLFFFMHLTTRGKAFILPSKLHFASTSAGSSRGFGGRRNDMKQGQERDQK
jgi:hypothetical protein